MEGSGQRRDVEAPPGDGAEQGRGTPARECQGESDPVSPVASDRGQRSQGSRTAGKRGETALDSGPVSGR